MTGHGAIKLTEEQLLFEMTGKYQQMSNGEETLHTKETTSQCSTHP
jgi:hypothetical protein